MNRLEIYDAAYELARTTYAGFDKMTPSNQDVRVHRTLASTIVRRLRGASTIHCAHQKLIFAVMEQAVYDTVVHDLVLSGQARCFFNYGEFDWHANMLGLDPSYVVGTLDTFFPWVDTR